MIGDAWGEVSDGFAQGPALTMMTENGDTVTCSAVWTEEDGVQVSLAMGDDVLTGVEAVMLAGMLMKMADLPAPGGVSGKS